MKFWHSYIFLPSPWCSQGFESLPNSLTDTIILAPCVNLISNWSNYLAFPAKNSWYLGPFSFYNVFGLGTYFSFFDENYPIFFQLVNFEYSFRNHIRNAYDNIVKELPKRPFFTFILSSTYSFSFFIFFVDIFAS